MGIRGVGGAGGARGDFEVPDDGKAEEAQGAKLPRTGWDDGDKLQGAVDRTRSKVDAGRSRPNHKTKWASAKRGTKADKASGPAGPLPPNVARLIGGKPSKAGKADKPVIVAKYGVPFPGKPDDVGGSTKPDKPVIVAKYGVPFPGKPGGTGNTGGTTKPDKPVIVAKYGVPFPGGKPGGTGGTKPDKPVIVAKYGVPFPGKPGGDEKPDKPVIVAKYGVPFPGSRK